MLPSGDVRLRGSVRVCSRVYARVRVRVCWAIVGTSPRMHQPERLTSGARLKLMRSWDRVMGISEYMNPVGYSRRRGTALSAAIGCRTTEGKGKVVRYKDFR